MKNEVVFSDSRVAGIEAEQVLACGVFLINQCRCQVSQLKCGAFLTVYGPGALCRIEPRVLM